MGAVSLGGYALPSQRLMRSCNLEIPLAPAGAPPAPTPLGRRTCASLGAYFIGRGSGAAVVEEDVEEAPIAPARSHNDVLFPAPSKEPGGVGFLTGSAFWSSSSAAASLAAAAHCAATDVT